MLFLKNVKNKALSFLLVKNMGKDFPRIKLSSNTDHRSNLKAVGLVISLTDSYATLIHCKRKQ